MCRRVVVSSCRRVDVVVVSSCRRVVVSSSLSCRRRRCRIVVSSYRLRHRTVVTCRRFVVFIVVSQFRRRLDVVDVVVVTSYREVVVSSCRRVVVSSSFSRRSMVESSSKSYPRHFRRERTIFLVVFIILSIYHLPFSNIKKFTKFLY